MPYSKIKKIHAREILDSRGNPTLEVDLETNLGLFRSSVPSGASRGKYEAAEIRDGGKRYQGKGVLKAVSNINSIIAPRLKEKEVIKQREIDDFLIKLDGSKNKSFLGANAICAVSMAVCRAGAKSKKLSLWKYIAGLVGNKKPGLPKACFNVINGGAHAGNDLDFQEFMIVPQARSFSNNLQIGSETYHQLKEMIKEKYGKLAVNVGDEGGFALPVKIPEEAIEIVLAAAKKLGYLEKMKMILDVAATQFFVSEKYNTQFGVFDSNEMVRYYSDLLSKYAIIGLEDPMAEEDLLGWKLLREKTETSKILLIGDDLLVTNTEKIKKAKKENLCNAMILKINQIGTVTEALEAAKLAKSYGWKIVVSHRSGETEDDFIADLAVGIGAEFIKTGAPARSERLAKYNRLLRIEEEI